MADLVASGAKPQQRELLGSYTLGAAYDEMFDRSMQPRPHYRSLFNRLESMTADEFRHRKAMTDLSMLQDGVGFTVYRQEEGIERVWPMDPVPRIIPPDEWNHIEQGLVQRLTALNLFLKDIYHDQLILRDRVIDPRLIYEGGFFRREFMGATVPRDIYIHVCGTDLVRDADGRYLVLEDNGRTPSGVSYMLQNRQVLKRVFPQRLRAIRCARHRRLPGRRCSTCSSYIAPGGRPDPDRRAAEPRHLQLGLFRAHVSGPAHGHRAGRGPRPGRGPEPRLHAHDPRPGTGRRDLSPHRRRLPRPA